MTINKLAKSFSISSEDMIEVLKCMKYIRKDYSDWEQELYDNGVVKDLDNIIKSKSLTEDLYKYKDMLTNYFYSRNSKNGSNLNKITIKNGILKNKSLINFLENS